MNKKILILCTGNSCRSQMAEEYLKYFDKDLFVVSAGTNPSNNVHEKTIIVMKENGFDLSKNKPKSVTQFLNNEFDYVITVCDEAKQECPVFTGKVKNQLHIGFDDPAKVTGSEEFIISEFKRVRDEIHSDFKKFYFQKIKTKI